jgi:hypothetical protein
MRTPQKENLTRMMQLAEEFFGTKNDPSQISITKKAMRRLKNINPGTMAEKSTKKGPVAWVLVIPTTKDLMNQFLAKQINEQELLNKTPLRKKYEALYFCSALVLPEYRGKGIAKNLAVKAVRSIKRTNPIDTLFYWAFSPEGERLAVSVAKEFKLPLLKRVEQ